MIRQAWDTPNKHATTVQAHRSKPGKVPSIKDSDGEGSLRSPWNHNTSPFHLVGHCEGIYCLLLSRDTQSARADPQLYVQADRGRGRKLTNNTSLSNIRVQSHRNNMISLHLLSIRTELSGKSKILTGAEPKVTQTPKTGKHSRTGTRDV